MNELKPCPFCGGIPAVVEDGYKAIAVHCFNCGADITAESEKKARAAWNRCAKPANEPLTLEQLRGMDGEPVWIDGGRFWALVCVCGQIVYLAENSGETVYAEKWMKHMGNIYRHPPEVCIGVDLASGHDFTAYGRPPERSENDG